MDYKEAQEYIETTTRFGSNLGLLRIKRLLELMGNPQDGLRYIHVAGTNGKGSVTSMISRILMESGYRTGIYTSPYLQRFTERIKINDDEIPEDEVARLISYIKPLVERVVEEGLEHPTEFEIITALMFKYFKENRVDFAVLEVGLGGRLDATNVIDPLVSVITTISYDHMAILGDTLGKIAYEKAGIIKPNGIAVVYPQQREAWDVFQKVCSERNALLIPVNRDCVKLKESNIDGQVFDVEIKDESYHNLSMKLLGEYQLLNCTTAIAAVRALSLRGIDIPRKSIYDGLKNVRWPGRLEVMKKAPVILLDGAHNIEGITSLKNALHKYFDYKRLILLMGVLRDKQYDRMCEMIMPEADIIVTTTPDSTRALSAGELCCVAKNYCSNVCCCDSIDDSFIRAYGMAGKDDMVLCCGSLYMIGRIRTIIESM